MNSIVKTNTVILLSSFLILRFGFAQVPNIEWQKCLGGSQNEIGYSIKQTFEGGYIVAGATSSLNGDVTGNRGSQDIWLVKLDSMGILQWQKCFGGSLSEEAWDVTQTIDGGYIMAGKTTSNDSDVTGYQGGGGDYWVVKTDSIGNLQWQKAIGGTAYDLGYSIQQTYDGGYIVAGFTYSNDNDVSGNHGGSDCWIVKLDVGGAMQWQKTLGGTDDDEAHSIVQTIDSGYIVGGFTNSNDGDVTGNSLGANYWVVKLDSNGNLQWQKPLGGTLTEIGHSIRQANDGGYIITGQSYSNDGDCTFNYGFDDYWVVKLNEQGNIQWQKSLGGTLLDIARSVEQTSDGGYIVAGRTESKDGDVTGNHTTLSGACDYWVVKLDSVGNLEWQKAMGGTSDDGAFAIHETYDGGYIVAGYSRSNDGDVSGLHGINTDFWVVKLASLGLTVHQQGETIFSIFPNPANEKLQLTIRNKHEAAVRIFNLIGEEVLITKTETAQTTLDIQNLVPGIYFISVQTPKGISTEKFVKE